MSYDLENVLYDVEALIKANLNTEIALVTSDKNDSVELRTIPNTAYFTQTMDDKVANYKEFVFIDIDEIQPVGLGPATSEPFAILVLIVTSDFNKTDTVRRMLRYGRALKQVFQKKWRSMDSAIGTIKIESIPVQDILLLNSTNQHKTIGLRIRGSIA